MVATISPTLEGDGRGQLHSDTESATDSDACAAEAFARFRATCGGRSLSPDAGCCSSPRERLPSGCGPIRVRSLSPSRLLVKERRFQHTSPRAIPSSCSPGCVLGARWSRIVAEEKAPWATPTVDEQQTRNQSDEIIVPSNRDHRRSFSSSLVCINRFLDEPRRRDRRTKLQDTHFYVGVVCNSATDGKRSLLGGSHARWMVTTKTPWNHSSSANIGPVKASHALQSAVENLMKPMTSIFARRKFNAIQRFDAVVDATNVGACDEAMGDNCGRCAAGADSKSLRLGLRVTDISAVNQSLHMKVVLPDCPVSETKRHLIPSIGFTCDGLFVKRRLPDARIVVVGDGSIGGGALTAAVGLGQLSTEKCART